MSTLYAHAVCLYSKYRKINQLTLPLNFLNQFKAQFELFRLICDQPGNQFRLRAIVIWQQSMKITFFF